MKAIIILLLLLAGCQKFTHRERSKCPGIDYDEFLNTWTWQTIQEPGGQPQPLNMGACQNITFTPDSAIYDCGLATSWTDLGCSYIDNEGSQQLFVQIWSDTLRFTGMNTGTIWILTK